MVYYNSYEEMYHMRHGGYMIDIIITNALFKNCSKDRIDSLMKSIKSKRQTFEKNTVANNTFSNEKQIMFILTGSAKVEMIQDDGSSTFLKRLKPGDVFGVLSIFNEKNKYPTHIVFEESSQVLCILEEEVLKLIRMDETILKNYLTFFNGQVQYLLDRIAIFSLLSAEERFMEYIIQSEKSDKKERPTMTKVELSEYLGISRATLYRVIGNLENQGIIEYDGKRFRLIKNHTI